MALVSANEAWNALYSISTININKKQETLCTWYKPNSQCPGNTKKKKNTESQAQ